MKKIFWVLVIIGAIVGGINFIFEALLFAKSAPQQAASAAISIGFVVLPYCLARAVDQLSSNKKE